MLDPRQPGHQFAQASGRQHEGVTSGDDHLPDLGMLGHIGQGRIQGGRRQGLHPARSHHLTAETEPAIDRAHMGDLQQHPVRIAMHDPLDRAHDLVAHRIAVFDRKHLQLGLARQELAADGVVSGLDQLRHGRGDRHGILRRHPLQRGQAIGLDQAGVEQGLGIAKGLGGGHGGGPPKAGTAHMTELPGRGKFCDPARGDQMGSATGVHTTWSMRLAPVASITSRSNPRAQPDASGIWPSAARKSSSRG